MALLPLTRENLDNLQLQLQEIFGPNPGPVESEELEIVTRLNKYFRQLILSYLPEEWRTYSTHGRGDMDTDFKDYHFALQIAAHQAQVYMERQFSNVELEFSDPEIRAVVLAPGVSQPVMMADILRLPLDIGLGTVLFSSDGPSFPLEGTPPLVRVLGDAEIRRRVRRDVVQRRRYNHRS